RSPRPGPASQSIYSTPCAARSNASGSAPPASAAARARRSSWKHSRVEEILMDVVLTALLGVVVLYVLSGLRVFKEYERGVLFVLGRSWGAKGPGLRFLPPLLTKIQTVSLRVVAMDIPPQDVITRDNISIKVN